MILKATLILLIFLNFYAFAQEENLNEPQQQINDFSLVGFGEKGKKDWDLQAKSADISTDKVKLKDITGNLYREEENIKLTGDRGDFNKQDGKVHLEQNVVITTSGGAKLTTDSLDWDRKNELISTKDKVNIERENIITQALGATGLQDLNKVRLEKYVRVDINSQEANQMTLNKNKIIITCYGPLEIDYKKNVATFKNNVKVDTEDSQIYSDRMDVYFVPSNKEPAAKTDKEPNLMGNKIDKIIAKGNVKIVREENISYSDEATYLASERKIVLTGNPKLIIYSKEGTLNAPVGN